MIRVRGIGTVLLPCMQRSLVRTPTGWTLFPRGLELKSMVVLASTYSFYFKIYYIPKYLRTGDSESSVRWGR